MLFMKLSKKEKESFERDGFILIRNFLSDDEVKPILNEAKTEIKKLEQPFECEEDFHEIKGEKTTLRRLRSVYDRSEVFSTWMRDVRVRSIAKELLGETPVITLAHHNSIMTKMPTPISVTCWHQDIRYWNFENDNLLSVWLSMGDEFLENGVLEFIPASHKVNFSEESFDQKTCFKKDSTLNKPYIDKKVSYELKSGDVVFFHSKTLHHANANLSDKPKISFVFTLRAESNKPITNTRSTSMREILLKDDGFDEIHYR